MYLIHNSEQGHSLYLLHIFIAMAKTSEEQYRNVAEALADDGAVMSQMFGMPSLKIKGKAFAGLYEDAMVFKLTGEPHKQALTERGAKLFEPMARRPMKEWVQVPATSSKKWKGYAEQAMQYVSGKTNKTSEKRVAAGVHSRRKK